MLPEEVVRALQLEPVVKGLRVAAGLDGRQINLRTNTCPADWLCPAQPTHTRYKATEAPAAESAQCAANRR